MTGRWKFLVSGFLCCFIIFIPIVAAGENPEAKNLYERAQFEISDGNYAEGLKFVDQALALAPDNLDYQVTRGQALMELKKYEEAEAQFLKVMAAGPEGRKKASTELAALYARTKRFDQAYESYSMAIEALPQRPDLYLARGSILVELKEYGRAEADFSKAVEVDPKVAPAAMLHRALASYRQEDYTQAKTRLDEALALNPSEALAAQIKKFKAAVEREEKARKWWGISATVVLQYDDNVSMEPVEGFVDMPGAPATGKDDVLFGGNVTGLFYLINRRTKEFGFAYTFRNYLYADLDENDLLAHTIGSFFSYNKNPWYFRLEGDASFYWANHIEKLTLYSLRPSATFVISEVDRTTVLAAYEYKLMHDGTDDVNRYVLGALHSHTFKRDGGGGLTARAGFQYELEEPTGTVTARSRLYELKGGVSVPLPRQFDADFGLSYAWVYFDLNPSFDPDTARDDRRIILSAKIGRAFMENLRADLMWTHTYNDSNLADADSRDLYEFHRNIFSLVLTGAF